MVQPPVSSSVADIRRDYRLLELDEQTAGEDPVLFFARWFAEAQAADIDEVNAMTLATAGADGRPHARIVLLKGMDARGFVFFTNYDSAKGMQLSETGHAALLFFWKELERQVRVEGRVERVSADESDAYFSSRPRGSRLGAWASPQSQIIENRAALADSLASAERRFAEDAIPRPPFWGGYRIVPERIEFWQGRSSRLHDRIVFASGTAGWHRSRLAP